MVDLPSEPWNSLCWKYFNSLLVWPLKGWSVRILWSITLREVLLPRYCAYLRKRYRRRWSRQQIGRQRAKMWVKMHTVGERKQNDSWIKDWREDRHERRVETAFCRRYYAWFDLTVGKSWRMQWIGLSRKLRIINFNMNINIGAKWTRMVDNRCMRMQPNPERNELLKQTKANWQRKRR